MSAGNGGATIDSLVTFKYKKKFSFSKRLNATTTDDEEAANGEATNSEDSSLTDSDVEELREKNMNWKGSAKLKSPGAARLESSEEENVSKKKQKKQKKSQKPHKKESLKEKENVADLNGNKSVEIEEWSDGDEQIRARNAENKAQRHKALDDMNTSDSSGSENLRKRKNVDDEVIKMPKKKKARKMLLSSDEEDGNEDEAEPEAEVVDVEEGDENSNDSNHKVNGKSRRTIESDESDATSHSTSTVASKKKKICIKGSSDDEVEEEEAPKKQRKHKKGKKEKKSKAAAEGEGGFDDDDDDYMRGGGASDDSDFEGENYTEDQKEAILDMFNTASTEDIQSMINISKNRVKSLVALRPFTDFADLRTRLSQRHLINVIDSAKDIIVARSIVGTLLEKCMNISTKLEAQVATLIQSTTDSDSEIKSNNTLELKSQPACLNKNLQLKPYQLIGLNWLCLMHKENINGILADEMGLGKTCQTISFLAHLFEQNKRLMHLIIVPPSTLDNWVREISVWCPDFNFTVYQGNLEERRQLRYDILNHNFERHLNAIVTTYGMISSTNEDKAFFKKLKIEYCVFDEAHMLKNMNSIRYQSLIKLQSKHKLLLTGTPLQNNLVELMSLLYFVMPDIFHHKTEYLNKIFAAKPANVDTDTFYNEKIAQAKGIMKPFIMRRLKDQVLKQLPKKIIEVIYCDMTLRQGKEYSRLVDQFKARKEQLLKEAEENAERKAVGKAANVNSNYMEIMDLMSEQNRKKKAADKEKVDSSSNVLMELRKAANHPLLRRVLYNDDKIMEMAKLIMKESPPDTVLDYVREDLSYMSDYQIHKLCPLYKCLKGYELANQDILDSAKFTILDSLLAEKKEAGDRCLIFSQFVIMLDIVEEFLKIKKYKYFRLDGSTNVSDRQDMIDAYNHDNEVFIFLLSTKAGGVGINLTAANVVIMHDIDYNPFNDKQAEDRCHRVGQTREVQVYKLISKKSIDCTMLKIQEQKLELGEDMSGTSENEKVDMISMLNEALNR